VVTSTCPARARTALPHPHPLIHSHGSSAWHRRYTVVAALDPPRAPSPPHAARQPPPCTHASTPRQWSLRWIRLGRPRPLTRLGSPLHPHTHKHTTQEGNEEKARATQPLNCTDQRSLTGPEPHADMPSMCPSAYLGALAMHARLLPPRTRVPRASHPASRLRPLPPHTRAPH
jgi:hypothetical protein